MDIPNIEEDAFPGRLSFWTISPYVITTDMTAVGRHIYARPISIIFTATLSTEFSIISFIQRSMEMFTFVNCVAVFII